MPTKIPSRQTKRFSMINKTLIMPRKNKYANKISSTTTKIPSTPTKIPNMPTKNLRCFVARQFLSQIYALFWRTFCRPKSMVAYQKGQISGMPAEGFGSSECSLCHQPLLGKVPPWPCGPCGP